MSKSKLNLDRAREALAKIELLDSNSKAPATGNPPTIDVSADCLLTPSRADVWAIWRTMLWPVPELLETHSPAKASDWGGVAGTKLYRMIGNAKADPTNAAGYKVNKQLGAALWRVRPISAKTIDNEVWPKYRSVAYLWAAWYLRNSGQDKPGPIPCDVAEVPDFLMKASALRVLAETTRSHAKGETILQPGESVNLPSSVTPPSCEITFSLKAP